MEFHQKMDFNHNYYNFSDKKLKIADKMTNILGCIYTAIIKIQNLSTITVKSMIHENIAFLRKSLLSFQFLLIN